MRGNPGWIGVILLSSGLLWGCDLENPASEWDGSQVAHEILASGFLLVGTHSTRPCTSCHSRTTFEPLFGPVDENDCVACHKADYDGQHSGSGYPKECVSCHKPTRWRAGTSNHRALSGGFDLIGTHADKACSACHDADTFLPLFDPVDENDCVACHQADYDDQHSGSGYSTDCTSCHKPTLWSNGSFDHDAQYFPVFAGKHANRWATCSTCHTNPADFSVFTCFGCHDHSQPRMDDKHDEEPGYVYESSACLSCHPKGSAG